MCWCQAAASLVVLVEMVERFVKIRRQSKEPCGTAWSAVRLSVLDPDEPRNWAFTLGENDFLAFGHSREQRRQSPSQFMDVNLLLQHNSLLVRYSSTD